MAMSGLSAQLGTGVYELAEVARYTGLESSRIRAWFKPRTDGSGRDPIFKGDYQRNGNDYAVSFFDLIDTLVVGQLRQIGVKMSVVRSAYNVLRKQLSTPHPFCHNNIYSDGEQVFIVTADQLGDESLREVVSSQQFFMTVRERLEKIDYNKSSKLAERWRIQKGIVVDPRISFGKPVIESTGVTTFVAANMLRANSNDVELTAELLGISTHAVLDAAEFEVNHRCRKAA